MMLTQGESHIKLKEVMDVYEEGYLCLDTETVYQVSLLAMAVCGVVAFAFLVPALSWVSVCLSFVYLSHAPLKLNYFFTAMPLFLASLTYFRMFIENEHALSLWSL